jgi:hypothetical protein
VASFYGVPAAEPPHPRVVLVPVPSGHGTHAQAIGRHLLIEIREGEGLIDELSPIVHENAHFLFLRIEPDRRRSLEEFAASIEPGGAEAWSLLREALPTALGQGVAAERFLGRRWRRDDRWYHLDTVDDYAKRLFPVVRETLAKKGAFDREFVRRAVAAHAEPSTELSPRSP